MKLLGYAFLSCVSIILSSSNALAKSVPGESILCKNKNLITAIAFSTSKYNIAICKEFGDAYHYIGQDKRSNAQVFLPIEERNNRYRANPWLLKARNGKFTYQVAEFNPRRKNAYISISVFENGNRIYHDMANNFIGLEE
ncbi:hypothetical protein NDA01_24800 [Trichocoleus desertorum AS-A10]|uniref:hypothetical protein n=1 Tax=Trichocoleus desertorum TaxID=1481672 RepID=UPI003296A842